MRICCVRCLVGLKHFHVSHEYPVRASAPNYLGNQGRKEHRCRKLKNNTQGDLSRCGIDLQELVWQYKDQTKSLCISQGQNWLLQIALQFSAQVGIS